MKILLTGANGQLGTALIRTAPVDAAIVALPRSGLDIADANAVDRAVASHLPDWIINTAAYTAVDRAESEPAAAYGANRDGPANLTASAMRSGARVCHVSTDFIFDGGSAAPYRTDAPANPLSVYGLSKAAGENAVRALLPDALIVRTAWVYGAHGPNFVRTMIRLMRDQREVRVVADQVGTPTHAASLARTIWALIANAKSGTHHFTDAGVASWYDFAVAIEEEALAIGLLDRAVAVVPISTADYPTLAVRPQCAVLDKANTWAVAGVPITHWRAELRSMLRELKELSAHG